MSCQKHGYNIMPAISLEEIDKLLRVETRRWNVEAKCLEVKNISCRALGGPDVQMGASGIRVIFNFWAHSNTHHHHHRHHVHEGLGVFPVPWSSKWNWFPPPVSSPVVVCFFVLLVYILTLVLVFRLCPSSLTCYEAYSLLMKRLQRGFWYRTLLTHWGRGHLNCLNARSRGF